MNKQVTPRCLRLLALLQGVAVGIWSGLSVGAIPSLAQVNPPRPVPATVGFEPLETPVPANGRRVALVIGNANYQAVGVLRNPVNDAQDMASSLESLGFEVILQTDASLQEMEEALREFFTAIRQGSVGVFYYAGHGIQSGGENYLIPVDAEIEIESHLRYEAMALGEVLDYMEDANNRINIVILDACRNNPFARSWRSMQRGLATIDAAEGVLLAYATAPGDVAADGVGRNGTFTASLLEYITSPGIDVEQLFKQVREDVWNETNGAQVPWTSSSLIGDFSFQPSSSPSSPLLGNPIAPLNFQEAPRSTPRQPAPLVCAGSVCE